MNKIKIPGDYQYRALNFGSTPQRFWHANKLLLLKTIGDFKSTDIILDAGCGSGNIVIGLSGQVKKAVGIDSNKEALNFAKERVSKLKIKNIELLNENLQKIPFERNYFDKIILFEVVEHLSTKEYKRILAEAYRVLKPTGQLFLTTPNQQSLWPTIQWLLDTFRLVPSLNDQHVLKLSIKQINKIISENGFRIEKVGTLDHFSPFISPLSWKLAETIFHFEVIRLKKFGPIIWLIATKNEN
jgi:ubiquinone/menaquinone biosynthesis C-methylase UbiE